jgi:hypothetical protein
VYLTQTKDLLRRHSNATIIWAHTVLGRAVRPTQASASAEAAGRSPIHREILAEMIDDPTLAHVSFDISWDEVAKYVVSSPEVTRRVADLINRHADRFLFGTDEVAPSDQQTYLRVYRQYDPLWALLTPEAQALVKKGNYERLFDAARTRVRAWERANVPGAAGQR